VRPISSLSWRRFHSFRLIRDDDSNGSTLLIGEGKLDYDPGLMSRTRGQLVNQMIRHRHIDANVNGESVDRPILLLAFNHTYVSMELAFPSSKGCSYERAGWVDFDATLADESETYWTVPLAFVRINSSQEKQRLARLLRAFIADTMKLLHTIKESGRVQSKTPWLESSSDVASARKAGDNVTIATTN